MKNASATGMLLILANLSLGVEPRDYGVYDELGLVHFEDVKAASKQSSAAMLAYRNGAYAPASRIYEQLLLANKLDDEAIAGLVACARRTNKLNDLVTKAKVWCKQGTNKDLYALNMIQALARWNAEVEAKGDDLVGRYIMNAQSANKNGFLVRFKDAQLPNSPRFTRQKFAALCKDFPQVEGLSFYRVKSYIVGYLGEGFATDDGRLIRRDDPENFPKPEIAVQLLSATIKKPNPPIWANYLNAFALIKMKQQGRAKPYRERVDQAARAGDSTYMSWSQKLATLSKQYR